MCGRSSSKLLQPGSKVPFLPEGVLPAEVLRHLSEDEWLETSKTRLVRHPQGQKGGVNATPLLLLRATQKKSVLRLRTREGDASVETTHVNEEQRESCVERGLLRMECDRKRGTHIVENTLSSL